MKYQDWLDGWLENYVKPTSKVRTHTRYGETIRTHISPRIGNLELSELSPYVLQCFVTELLNTGNLRTGKGLSPSSVNVIITIVQNSLKNAYSLGLADEYVADRIKRPKPQQKKIEQYIMSSERTRLYGVVICLYTGLRLGELLALEWGDIDFERAEVYITKTCHDGKDENGVFRRITGAPKTESSIRTIPLPKQLIPILKKLKRKSQSTYVVSNGEKLVAYRSYQKSFETLLKRLELPHRGFHALRHTFATRAIECGMDVKTLSEILGHKNPIVTLNKYAHSLTKHKKEMMNLVGRLL